MTELSRVRVCTLFAQGGEGSLEKGGGRAVDKEREITATHCPNGLWFNLGVNTTRLLEDFLFSRLRLNKC